MLRNLYPIPCLDDIIFFSELGITDELSHKYYIRVAPCVAACVNANVRETDGDFICVEHMQMCDTSITSFIGDFGEKFNAERTSVRCASRELLAELQDRELRSRNETERAALAIVQGMLAREHPEHFHGYLEHQKVKTARLEIPWPGKGGPIPDNLLAERAADFRDERWAYMREYGHFMHACAENFYNNQMCESDALALADTHPQYFGGFLHYHAAVLERGWRPFRAELRLYDTETRLVGTIDLAYLDRENRVILVDWKFSKNVKIGADWGRYFRVMHPPVLDTTFWKYVLQLNSYRAILERNTPMRVHKMYVVVFHEQIRPDFEEFEVPDRRAQIDQMIAERLKVLPALTQQQYEEAVREKRPALVEFALKNGAKS